VLGLEKAVCTWRIRRSSVHAYHPVLRSPALMPSIVAEMARLSSSESGSPQGTWAIVFVHSSQIISHSTTPLRRSLNFQFIDQSTR
jgi:hypothetical protein